MGIFYEAEAIALRPDIVRKSFSDVGLWPWNPEKILSICEKHSPAVSQPDMNEPKRDLVDVIKVRKEKQEARRDQILNNLKGVEVVTIQKVVNPKSRSKRGGSKFGR